MFSLTNLCFFTMKIGKNMGFKIIKEMMGQELFEKMMVEADEVIKFFMPLISDLTSEMKHFHHCYHYICLVIVLDPCHTR